jgi:hypothetical protein
MIPGSTGNGIAGSRGAPSYNAVSSTVFPPLRRLAQVIRLEPFALHQVTGLEAQRTSRKFVLTGRIFRAKLSGQVGLPLRIDLGISFPLVVGETAFALILFRPLGSWAPLVEDQLSNFL